MSKKSNSVIIVEDERIMSTLLKIKLKDIFKDVEVYSNGLNGLKAIKETKPNLVVLDVMLPGMQGFDILSNIKANSSLSDTKVLMLTVKSREEDVQRGFELETDEYMSKPFKMNEFLLRINKLLD